MRKLLLLLTTGCVLNTGTAQNYDIKINFKDAPDTMMFLVKYTFDQQYIVDTAKNVKNGAVRFTGKGDLDKGVYTLVSQEKAIYFDFFVNDSQKFVVTTDNADMVGNLKVTGSRDNELFFSYIKYITSRNKEFNTLREKTKGMNKSDSTNFMKKTIADLNSDVQKFEKEFMEKSKGTFVHDVMNLKNEKQATDVPKASNGRPDSVYVYYWYKNHFFDGVDFTDERIIRTPFFDDKIKRYFDQVIIQHPDTIIKEIDNIMAKCKEGNLVWNLLLAHFTHKYEQSKIMGFDKIFVHVADKYVLSGKASNVYSEETVGKIKERVDIMRNLLLDSKVPELYAIDTTNGKQVRKMGFDTASTSKSITDLYYKHIEQLTPMFRTLYQVNAKYTVLVFWAVDCGHCQTEIPKLHEDLKPLKGKIDYKVFAVQTKDDLFESWRKFLVEKKLTDFINVFDPIHINNLKEKYDIYSTPVIYVLDRDKRIKAKRLGSEQVVEMLKTLEEIEKAKGVKK